MPGQRPDSWSIRCARLHTAPPLRGRGKGGQSPLNPTPNPAEIRWSAFSRFSGLSPYPKGGGACAAPQGLSRSIIQPGSSFWRGGRPNKARSWSRSRYASIAAMSRSSGHSLLFTLAKIMAPTSTLRLVSFLRSYNKRGLLFRTLLREAPPPRTPPRSPPRGSGGCPLGPSRSKAVSGPAHCQVLSRHILGRCTALRYSTVT